MNEGKTSKLHLHRINLIVWISIITLGLLALISYFLLDERIFFWFQKQPVTWYKNNWLEPFKLLGKAWLLICLLLSWLCITGRKRPVLIALLALLLSGVIVHPVKLLTHRPRPQAAYSMQEQKDGNDISRSWSFPSADTAAIFAVAAASAFFVGWPWIPVLFATAGAIGFLRIATLAHHTSDVFVGAAAGIFSGWLALQILLRRLSSSPPSGFNWYRAIAAAGVILTILLFGLSEGADDLLIFLKAYVPIVAGVYLVTKAAARLKRQRTTS